jgi:hypothetical protein
MLTGRNVLRAELFVALASYRQKIKNVAGFPSAVSANLGKVHDCAGPKGVTLLLLIVVSLRP